MASGHLANSTAPTAGGDEEEVGRSPNRRSLVNGSSKGIMELTTDPQALIAECAPKQFRAPRSGESLPRDFAVDLCRTHAASLVREVLYA